MFPTDTTGLADAATSEAIDLTDGAEFRLTISPVRKQLGDDTVRMLGYNGSIPGPTIRSAGIGDRRSTSHNDGDQEATVHWHGLRLENRYDGTHETQAPIPIGGKLHVPGAVPRRRALLVPPSHPRGLRPGDGPLREHHRRSRSTLTTGRRCDRELVLTLDDVLIEDGQGRTVQPNGDDLRSDGPVRQPHPHRRRSRSRALVHSPAKSCGSTSPTPRTRASSTSHCRARA